MTLDTWALEAGRPLRLLLSETWDPDGAMFRWLSGGLEANSVEVLTIPTQEAVGLVGPGGLSAAWRAIAADFRPDVVLVHPPYDYLDRATIDAMRAGGAKVCAFAFDEPLFAPARRLPSVGPDFLESARTFDAYFVTAAEDATRLAASGVSARVLRFCTNEMPFEEVAPVPSLLRPIETPLERSAVLVGRPYARRIALVARLAEAGVPVHVYGHGWSDATIVARLPGGVGIGPPLQRGAMNEVLRRAGVVITTGDWEQQPVAMVKYRFLEAAMCAAPQVVQASPDLATYFDVHEVETFSDDDECLRGIRRLLAEPVEARALGQRSRSRALREHHATGRLVELIDALGLSRTTDSGSSLKPEAAAWELLVAMVAHDAERRGAVRLAAEAYQRLFDRTASADAAAGLGRLALTVKVLGDEIATRAPSASLPSKTSAIGLYAQVGALPGPGLGHMAFIDPTAERLAVEFALDPLAFDWDSTVSTLSPDAVIVMATLLELPEGWDAAVTAPWRRLFESALAAQPTQTELMVDAHRDRWLAHVAELHRS